MFSVLYLRFRYDRDLFKSSSVSKLHTISYACSYFLLEWFNMSLRTLWSSVIGLSNDMDNSIEWIVKRSKNYIKTTQPWFMYPHCITFYSYIILFIRFTCVVLEGEYKIYILRGIVSWAVWQVAPCCWNNVFSRAISFNWGTPNWVMMVWYHSSFTVYALSTSCLTKYDLMIPPDQNSNQIVWFLGWICF